MTRYVMIYPGSPVVSMPGASKQLPVVVRNVSVKKLTALRLTVKSEACEASVTPAQVAALIPGARVTFHATLTRTPRKPARRYPLQLTLHAQGLPVAAGLDLQLDTGPAPQPGWVDVGQVTLVPATQRRTTLYLLAGTPLLLVLAWLLWRWSRRRSGR